LFYKIIIIHSTRIREDVLLKHKYRYRLSYYMSFLSLQQRLLLCPVTSVACEKKSISSYSSFLRLQHQYTTP
jgi:hypothetical protein